MSRKMNINLIHRICFGVKGSMVHKHSIGFLEWLRWTDGFGCPQGKPFTLGEDTRGSACRTRMALLFIAGEDELICSPSHKLLGAFKRSVV